MNPPRTASDAKHSDKASNVGIPREVCSSDDDDDDDEEEDDEEEGEDDDEEALSVCCDSFIQRDMTPEKFFHFLLEAFLVIELLF
jgi:hypothetical protein